jgi:hypothetical protein
MRLRGQSAVEFLAVYTWTFVILTIMVAIVAAFLISKSPASYVPPTCYISIDMSCQNLVLFQNTSGSIGIVVFYFNSPPTGIAIPTVNSFSVEPAFSQQTYFGVCSPPAASAHTYITCNASMKGYRPGIGTPVNLQFIVTWNLCNGKFAGCKSYNTSGTGTAFTTSQSGNFLNRITVEVLCNGAACNPPGLVYVDGGSFYGAANSPTFIGTVQYQIYATAPSKYTFDDWTYTAANVQVTNDLSQSTTVDAVGSGLLIANFH